jgi:hypothetical protein
MALRIATRLPRLLVVGIVLLLASATLAVGAAQRMNAVPQGSTAPVAQEPMVVPDVTGQAFVFAKGTIEDTGFAWRVVGGVHGYAVNKVASQSPAPGTKLKDTGAPTIALTLTRTGYPEKGEPEDLAPYLGTSVEPVAAKPLAPAAPAVTTPAAPAATTPSTPAAPAATPAAPSKPAAAPKPAASSRPAAFTVANAPKEPLDEMPLTRRASLLTAFIKAHPKQTPANVRHFLYQHTWIVTGSKFGWWHGAEALRQLIVADRTAAKLWGLGGKSELVARKALAEVEKRAK